MMNDQRAELIAALEDVVRVLGAITDSEPPEEGRQRMLEAWRCTDTYREAFSSYRAIEGITLDAVVALAEEGISLGDTARMSDRELLALPRIGRVTLGRLRAAIAGAD